MDRLCQAAKEGDFETVKALIAAGADINQANNNGYTPLWNAADRGHHKVVQALIDAGADINQANKYGTTLLGNAANRGHAEVVMRLLIAGCKRVNLPISVSEEMRTFINDTEGWTRLHYTSYMGDFDLVSSVLHKGVDIDFTTERGKDNYSCTPIGAVALNDQTSDMEKENVMNLLQVAIKPLHVAMESNPDLYRQAWPPEITEILLKTMVCYRQAPIVEHSKDTCLAIVFQGIEDDSWAIILSFLASHNDAPRLRQKLAEERARAQVQEAVEVGQAPPEEVSVAP